MVYTISNSNEFINMNGMITMIWYHKMNGIIGILAQRFLHKSFQNTFQLAANKGHSK